MLKLCIVVLLIGGLFSCIRDEAANAEADIIACSINNRFIKSDPVISNDKVVVLAFPRIDRTQLAPTFELTPGAVISPASGTVRDFSSPQTYTVTSEDGNWQKVYTLSIDTSDLTTFYHFEDYEVKGKYHVFYEMIPASVGGSSFRQDIWATGNPGYALTGIGSQPENFPSVSADGGVLGRCAKLETRSTGKFGMDLKPQPMPIAAGNLFLGTFSAANALKAPREATHFGLPFGHKPLSLNGFYRYKAGAEFTDPQMNVLPGRKDICDIYAVFYETDDQVKYLDGNNILTHPNIVAVARISDARETDGWTRFEIPFEYRKEVDPVKLGNYRYNLAVVFSSSIKGDVFEGAIGSTLYVDEVRVVY